MTEISRALKLAVAGENFTVPAGDVSEVIRVLPLTRCPLAPASLMGLANLRGRVLPVIAMASIVQREGRAPTPHNHASARIVIIENPVPIGVFVETVPVLTQRAAYPALPLNAFLERDFGALLSAPPPPHRPKNSSGNVPQQPAGAGRKTVLIVFSMGGQDYALPAMDVFEIMALPAAITEVPGAGQEVLGVIERRGGALPLLRLRSLLGLPPLSPEERNARIVVTRIGPHMVGLIVDRIQTIVSARENMIATVPPVLMRSRGEARIGALCRREDGRLLPILAPDMLFEPETARIPACGTLQLPEQTAHASAQAPEKFIGFCLGEEAYAIPATGVDRVVRCPSAITPVPHAPDFLRGLINLRGHAVPVIDQRARFGARNSGVAPRVLLILAVAGRLAAFCIDGVARMLEIPVTQLSPAPPLSIDGGAMIDRIACIEREGRMIILMDAAALLDHAAREMVISLGTAADFSE